MIGRQEEIDELNRLYESDESEFVAIYGRRRVGKTYLVRETFSGRFVFSHIGLQNGSARQQLRHFARSVEEVTLAKASIPKDWFEAFDALKRLIVGADEKRKVVFIDEMPWMDTPKSGFLTALESFWNGWASNRKDILLIVCGSAASWMVKNLFRNKGGLHNRVTSRICLHPFTLRECELYAEERGLAMERRDIAECYMALGGIPYYWRYLKKGLSVAQNFDRLFFADGAPLRDEFDELYASLFRSAEIYKAVVAALSEKKIGMTRKEIFDAIGIKPTGKLTAVLETLESSGFIRNYRPFGAVKRNSVYQLVDCFTLFHFRFLNGRTRDEHYWTSTQNAAAQSVWRGLSFEILCLRHYRQMCVALGIAGVHAETYAWRHKGDDVYPDGAQIDLIIDRDDNVINVCEMKYSSDFFGIDKVYDQTLSRKLATFRGVTKTKKSLHLTLVTANGLLHNGYWNHVQAEITLDQLF